MRFRVAPGSQASHRFEDAMQVVGAEAGTFREYLKAWYLIGLFNEPAKVCHQGRVLRRLWRLVRLAAFAGTEAGTLGIGRREMKLHILRLCSARCARRAAVNTCGFDLVIELPVGCGITCNHGWPTRVAQGGGRMFELVGFAHSFFSTGMRCWIEI